MSKYFFVNERVKIFIAMLAGAAAVYVVMAAAAGVVPTVEAQSDAFLARRVDQVEQRFYSLESRLTRIEMESRQPSISSPVRAATDNIELQYLRTQIDSLRTRLGEAECALLKLDERTLTAAQRRASPASETCRRSWGERIVLSARPGQ